MTTTLGIIKDFCEVIAGDECSQWRVGVAADDRGIPGGARFRIQRSAANATEARNIARAFWNIGCRMAVCDENESAVCVYAFREEAVHLCSIPRFNEVFSQPPPRL
jgi:hypothetical protein